MIAIQRPQTRFAAALPAAAPTNVTLSRLGARWQGRRSCDDQIPRMSQIFCLRGALHALTFFPDLRHTLSHRRVSAGPSVSAQNAKRIEWVCLRDLVVTMCTAGASTMCCLFKFRALRESWSHGHRDRIQFRLFNSISIFNIR